MSSSAPTRGSTTIYLWSLTSFYSVSVSPYFWENWWLCIGCSQALGMFFFSPALPFRNILEIGIRGFRKRDKVSGQEALFPHCHRGWPQCNNSIINRVWWGRSKYYLLSDALGLLGTSASMHAIIHFQWLCTTVCHVTNTAHCLQNFSVLLL